MEQTNCLVEELKRLKESSKEAVENLNSFSSFKEYMHVKRNVEDELLQLLEKANRINKSQLILVCGGVGDGKSHLISYFKKKYPNLMFNFKLHNDATESFEPHKTSIDTLNDVLEPFSDYNLENGEIKKLILAINLGALNNFIESKYKVRFQKLINYVKEKEILEATINNSNFDMESNFQFINFSDYHMFSLTEDGPRSQYMIDIINKVTNPVEENIFYQKYKEYCCKCKYNYKCPIKENYEMLMKDNVKTVVVSILIEAIIKKKIIISTRSLLNFIYDLIVNSSLDNLNQKELFNTIKKMNFEEYLDHSITSNLYDHRELSNILDAISQLDPINIRNEDLDNLIIKLNITDDISNLFNEYLDLDKQSYLGNILSNNKYIKQVFDQNKTIKSKQELKNKLVKLFVRLYKFIPKNKELDLTDHRYLAYMKNLYYWNKGMIRKLSTLYEDVKIAIYKWNGENSDERINLFIGKNQTRYRISQKLTIEPYLDNLKCLEELELHKFIPNLKLEFKGGDHDKPCSIDIDYNLYDLLQNIKFGYRPNKKDKYNFINFVEFVNKITQHGNQNKELIIEDKYSNQKRIFKLTFKEAFDEYEFSEIRGI